MGCQFNEDELIKYESRFCIACGGLGYNKICVRCRSKELGASKKAIITLLYTDGEGEVIAEEDVWLH